MIRRLNFTGRRAIARNRIEVRLTHASDGCQTFSIEFELEGLRFPPKARVFVEAYNALSYMRFDFGTVGKRSDPPNTRLAEITPRPLARFRLKVVEPSGGRGLLLGVADRIAPLRSEQDESHRQPLLPVDFCDLGDRVWRLDLSDWPVLELNHHIDGIAEEARSGEDFLALVYPEVVRQILRSIVLDQEQVDPDFDDTEWTSLWLRYICAIPGVGRPPEGMSVQARADREVWVEEATQAFCRSREVRRRFATRLERDARPSI